MGAPRKQCILERQVFTKAELPKPHLTDEQRLWEAVGGTVSGLKASSKRGRCGWDAQPSIVLHPGTEYSPTKHRVSGAWRSGCRAAANSMFGEIEEELFVREMEMSQHFDPPRPLLSLTAEKRSTLLFLCSYSHARPAKSLFWGWGKASGCVQARDCPAGGEMHMLGNWHILLWPEAFKLGAAHMPPAHTVFSKDTQDSFKGISF